MHNYLLHNYVCVHSQDKEFFYDYCYFWDSNTVRMAGKAECKDAPASKPWVYVFLSPILQSPETSHEELHYYVITKVLFGSEAML